MKMAEFLPQHSFTFMYYCTSEKGNKEKMNSNFIIPLYILIISFTLYMHIVDIKYCNSIIMIKMIKKRCIIIIIIIKLPDKY